MVYKKYIKRGGKTYGPYLYKSIKKDGKVITEYVGHPSETKIEAKNDDFHGRVKKSNKNFWIVTGFLSIVCIALLVYVFFIFQFGATGKAFAEIQETYSPGEQITGQVNLILKQGELIPADTKLVVDNSGDISEYNINDFLSQQTSEGNFYIENKNISGSGLGYGDNGQKEIYPKVTFSFKIILSDNSEGGITNETSGNETQSNDTTVDSTSGGTTEPIPPEQTSVTSNPEQSAETPPQTDSGTSSSPETSTQPSSESQTSSGSSSTDSSGGLTGAVIGREVIQGEVSKNSPYEYSLSSGETVEIVDSSQPVHFEIQNSKAVFTTDYSEFESGFGADFISNKTVLFPINLSGLGIIAKEGTLKISFVYNNEEITSVSKDIVVKEFVNETILNGSNITNFTLPINITNGTKFNITNSTGFNVTDINVTNETNENFSIVTIQHGAVLGQPVKWTKEIIVAVPGVINVDVPKGAENINVNQVEQNPDTGSSEGEKKIDSVLPQSAGLTGNVVEVTPRINTGEVAFDAQQASYEINYETPAPTSIEGDLLNGKKEINIIGNDEVHYQDVLAFSQLPYEVQNPDSVKIYWFNNGQKELVDSKVIDSDENGLYDNVQWVVPRLSNESYELSLTIINVQSYPTVGGNWTVLFNTTGTADLTVTTINGTTFGTELPSDLEFLLIKCENEVQNYSWVNGSVFVSNYSCNDTGYEISHVMTAGKHHLEFDFGGIKAYANNDAGPSICTGASNEVVCDNFNDNSLNTSIWDTYLFNVNASVSEFSQNVILSVWGAPTLPTISTGVGLIDNHTATFNGYKNNGNYSIEFNYYPNDIYTTSGNGFTGLFIRNETPMRESTYGAPKGKSFFIKLGGWSQGLSHNGVGIYYYDSNVLAETPYTIGENTSNIFSSSRWYNITVFYDGIIRNISVYVDGSLKTYGIIPLSNFSQISNNTVFEFYASATSFFGNRVNTYDNFRINSTGLPYTCGNLIQSTNLVSDLLSSSGNCINVTANNVVLDCLGHKISYVNGNAIFVNGKNNVTVKNCVIEQSGTTASLDGINLNNSYNINVINNTVTSKGSASNGIAIYNVKDSVFDTNNLNVTGDTSNGVYNGVYGLETRGSVNVSFSNFNISAKSPNSNCIKFLGNVSNSNFSNGKLDCYGNGVYLYGFIFNFPDLVLYNVTNNSFYNLNISNFSSKSISSSYAYNNYFINSSFNESNYVVSVDDGNFSVLRYGDVNVTTSLGVAVSSASVSSKDVFNNNAFSGVTGVDGLLSLKPIVLDYKRTGGAGGGGIIFYNNYTLNISKAGYVTKIVLANFSNSNKIINVVLAYQSDTCSPDVGGNLAVTTNLTCSGYTINVGNLNVTSTGNLTLISGSLIVNQTNVQQGGSFTARNSKGTLWQNGNLTISGNYTLDNSTLRLNGTNVNGSVGVNVTSTGNMTIRNQSNVTNGDNIGYRYYFIVNNGSNFSMTSSNLEYAGWDANVGKGVEINTSVNNFTNNTLRYNFANWFYGPNNNITNNNFIFGNNLLMLSGMGNTIYNNNFSNASVSCLQSLFGYDNISYNNLSYCGTGISLLGQGGEFVYKNKIYSCSSECLSLYSINNSLTENNLSSCSEGILLFALGNGENLFVDGSISQTISDDIIFTNSLFTPSNLLILNSSFDKSKVSFVNNTLEGLIVKWYLDVNVTDPPNEIPVSGANVFAWNVSGSQVFLQATNATGQIQRQNLTEYYQNSTGFYYSTNYTINVSKNAYFNYTGKLNITNSTRLDIPLYPIAQYNTCNPIPSTADLIVNTTLFCLNTNVIANSLNVTATGNLILNYSNLTVRNTTIMNGGKLWFRNSKSSFWQNENLTVSGNLTLDNSTLRLNGTTVNGSVGINVTSTGNFTMKNNSLITNGLNANYRYAFIVGSGSNVFIFNSTVEYAGWNSAVGQRGLEVSGVSNISSSTFRNNYYGLTLLSVNNRLEKINSSYNMKYGLSIASYYNTINGSLFRNNGDSAIYLPFNGGHSLINNSVLFFNSGSGIDASNNVPNITVANNNLSSNLNHGISFTNSPNSVVRNNFIYNHTSAGARAISIGVDSNSSIYSNVVNRSSVGIYLSQGAGLLFNNSVINSSSQCYYIYDRHNETQSLNNATFCGYGFFINESDGLVFNKSLSQNNTYGFYFQTYAKNNTIINLNSTNDDTVVFSLGSSLNTSDNKFIDSNFSSTRTYEAYLRGASGVSSLIFLNVSFNRTKVSLDSDCGASNCIFFVKWYMDVNVSNSSLLPVDTASVNLFDLFTSPVFSQTTNSSGMITRQNFTEYSQNNNFTFINHNNHTLNISKSGYADYSSKLNLTNNTFITVLLNRLPTLSNVLLNTTSGYNLSSDNLSVYYSSADIDNDNVAVVTNWYLNGTSIDVLNLPFDTQVNGSLLGIRDYSSFSNVVVLGNATAGSAPTWNSSGRVGGAYSFDGVNDFIDAGNNLVLNVTKNLTIELWIKPAMSHETGINYGVMAKALNPLWSWQLRFGNVDAGRRLGFQINNGSIPGMWVNVDQNLVVGQWYHVVASYNGTHSLIYLNGLLKEFKPVVPIFLSNSSVPVVIGQDGWGNYFNGTIDEVRIYNRSLTPQQIYENYLAGLANKSVEKIVDQETSLNDVWKALLVPNDGKNDGLDYWTNNVSLINNPPFVTSISLSPSVSYTNDTLYCVFNATDFEETSLNVSVEWYRDGVNILNTSINNYTRATFYNVSLNNSYTHNSESFFCNISLTDGSLNSLWNSSNNAVIQNYTTSLVITNETGKSLFQQVKFTANYSSQKIGDIKPSFFSSSDLDSLDSLYTVKAFDYNNDGIKDSIVYGAGIGSGNGKVVAMALNGTVLWTYSGLSDLIRAIRVGDVNGDGVDDIVFIVGDYDGHIFVLDRYGNLEKEIDITSGGGLPFLYSLELGDVSGDKVSDIIVGASSETSTPIVAYNGNGSNIWNYSNNTLLFNELRTYDSNNDGTKDYILAVSSSSLVALNATTGNMIWNYSTQNTFAGLALGDVTGSSLPEVFTIKGNSVTPEIYGFDISNGNLVWNSSFPTGYTFGGEDIATADIGGNGLSEIFAQYYDNYAPDTGLNSYLDVFNSTQNLLWNMEIFSWGLITNMNDFYVDDSYKPRIAVGSQNGIFALIQPNITNGTLSLYENFSQIAINNSIGDVEGHSEAIDGSDFNNDGVDDIIVASKMGYIKAYQSVDCDISFNDSVKGKMTWNSSSGLWDYNRSFSVGGIYKYNITCYKGGYETKLANSSVNISFNALPTVQLLSPPNDNYTTNRTPMFVWNGTDLNGDTLIYQLNVTCVVCSIDNRWVNTTSQNYSVVDYLKYLYDNGFYYNWTVRASDDNGVTWGSWATPWKLNIQSLVSINLLNRSINFGSLLPDASENTTDNSPLPFLMENNGNSVVNVSINSTDLWTSQHNPSKYYQYKIDDYLPELNSFNKTFSQINWAFMPNASSPYPAISFLNWSDKNDSVEIDINITVPNLELPGSKGSLVNFTAVLAE